MDRLAALAPELATLVFDNLDVDDIIALKRTNRQANAIASTYGPSALVKIQKHHRERIRDQVQELDFTNVDCLTALRRTAACQSFPDCHDQVVKFLNQCLLTLEHFNPHLEAQRFENCVQLPLGLWFSEKVGRGLQSHYNDKYRESAKTWLRSEGAIDFLIVALDRAVSERHYAPLLRICKPGSKLRTTA